MNRAAPSRRLALTTRAGLALLATVACVAQAAPPQSPEQLFGPLYEAVQTEHIFADGKTFADATPREDPETILRAWHAEQPEGPEALRAFVLRHFDVPHAPTEKLSLKAHIAALWPQLTRPPLDPPAGSSALALPAPYVVPGGRFREMYYWDSYFTMLGLVADGHDDLVEGMIDNFTSLIERFGHIPNGTRTYYLGRSQPPFFALMLDLSKQTDPAIRARRLAALRKEHAYWMAGEACATAAKPCERVMRMPDGSLLNRYWDDNDTPRDESYAEDRTTAAKASGRDAAQVYRDLRAGAESGWDFSSRWLTDPHNLTTIRTTRIVPVDLNALLWAMETRIEKGCEAAADKPCAAEFAQRAARRKAAVDRYLWSKKDGRFADWSLDDRAPTPVLSSATLYPLFTGMASAAQAKAMAGITRTALLAPGGLRTTTLATGLQWDAPNGWAPLQWVAIDGLGRYGEQGLARDIARRWVETVQVTYRETGKMLEKYDVEERLPGGGGEYPLQDGFGWTNGVTRAILERYPELESAGATPNRDPAPIPAKQH
ncbi:alpha,alpha-trehalase [Novosphingobium sp. PhB165]|uniref:alpha,alpha-trehalase TreF n=1 Tax=Novosphingobium sp. PhB165 TaxID=2485105 RepID=UPI0010D8957B|nr:alpha,alpha-trehalase TreF [Novosphingobium sp. PhB165]TCM19381.1 alpha,alpha-trehalase [Novosphingobium sp. PhB165]